VLISVRRMDGWICVVRTPHPQAEDLSCLVLVLVYKYKIIVIIMTIHDPQACSIAYAVCVILRDLHSGKRRDCGT